MRKIKNIFINLLGAAVLTAFAAQAGAVGFTGDFLLPEGANYDGGNMDGGWATAYYANSVYVVGVSSPTGGFLVRYSTAGVMQASGALPGVELTGVAVNAAGVYAVGTSYSPVRMVIAKFNNSTLALVSSKTWDTGLTPASGADVALCAAGNAYVIGTNLSLKGVAFGMYDPNLATLSESGFETAGDDAGTGIAVDGTDVYMAGHSLIASTTYFLGLKYSLSDYLSVMYASTSLTGIYLDELHELGGKIAVNPVTHQVYAALNQSHNDMRLARFNPTWNYVDAQVFNGSAYAAASDVVIDSTGNVLVTGSYNTGAGNDYPVLLKYSPSMVFISSAARPQTYGYESASVSLNPVSGDAFGTGVYFSDGTGNEPGWDMRTVRFSASAAPALRQISGTVTYAGTYDPAAVLTVRVSTSADFRGTPFFTSIPSPLASQPYTISNVPAGTYYMALTASINWVVADSTDPWGVHGQLGTPTPIDVTAGDAAGVDVAMIDGNSIPNPWSMEPLPPATVDCLGTFGLGGECRINGGATFATGIATDIFDSRYLLLTNLTDSAIVKFDYLGDIVSSVTVKYSVFNDIKLNAFNDDFYVAAQGPVSGVRVYRYNSSLALVSSVTVAGYQGARQLDFDAQGAVYTVSTKDNGGDYDIRVVKFSEALVPQDDWSDVSPGADQGYGIAVDGTDVFVTGIQRPDAFPQVAVIKLDGTSVLSKTGSAWADSAPFTFPEGVGFNNIRVAADSTGVYAAFNADLLASTATAVYRFTRADMALGYSSATMAGAGNFGDMKIKEGYLYLAAEAVNQARVTKYSAASFSPVASKTTNLLPYGLAPGALAFGVVGTASEVFLGGVIPYGMGDIAAGAAELALIDGPVPVIEQPQDYTEGTNNLLMAPDGSGGAYMVFDSTVGPNELRMVYVRRVDASNHTLWAYDVTQTAVTGINELYALPDGSGGLYAGWFTGGHAYAQHYDANGTVLWDVNGVRVSSGPVDGGEFVANPQGGFFAVFGYIQTDVNTSLTAQSVRSDGNCNWPAYGPCSAAAGTPIPAVDFAGEGAGAAGTDGSFMFFWGGDTDENGYLQIAGSKLDASGALVWTPTVKSLYASGTAQLGYDLEAAADGAGGAYVVWSSSESGARALYAQRYNSSGVAESPWMSPLQLTGAVLPADYYLKLSLTSDDEGFSVLYSSNTMTGASEVRVVRGQSGLSQLAAGFSLNGKLLGSTSDSEQSLVYDGTAYHIAWNQWETGLPAGNYHRVAYQKMAKDGTFTHDPYYSVGLASDCVKIDVSTDGADGALVGWMEKTGGGIETVTPRLLDIPLAVGPVSVYLSTRSAAPAVYLTGQPGPALLLDVRTVAGQATVTNLRVHVNPAGAYTDVAAVSLYADNGEDGIWSAGHDLISSAAVSGAYVDLAFPAGTMVNTTPGPVFLALTPALAAAGNSVNLALDDASALTTTGEMQSQGFYPVVSPLVSVTSQSGVTDLAVSPGQNLASVPLSWTYPQAIPSGQYMIKYSTDPADLAGPEAPAIVTPLTSVTAGSGDSILVSDLPEVAATVGGVTRVFPYHFALWLYNGTSTSPVSNLVQNQYFPLSSSQAGEAVLAYSDQLQIDPADNVRSAHLGMDRYTAFTFYGTPDNLLTLRTPAGAFYYKPAVGALEFKDLAVDPSGFSYLLAMLDTNALVLKIAPDGEVLWVRDLGAESAKAITFGGGAPYVATEVTGAGGDLDVKLRKLYVGSGGADNGNPYIYDTSEEYGCPSNDRVNSLEFTSDPQRAYLYLGGAVGEAYCLGNYFPRQGRVAKIADTGVERSPSTAYVAGAWPLRHNVQPYNPSEVTRVRVIGDGDLLVAGYERPQYYGRYGADVWLNKYSASASQLFPATVYYSETQYDVDEVPTGLDYDGFGNIYVSGYADKSYLSQGYDLLLLKFGPGGQLSQNRVYDSGSPQDGWGSDVFVSSDNYANVYGPFTSQNYYGVYSLPPGGGGTAPNAQFFAAMEGPYTGSADLMWNYTSALPEGATFYVQYSADPAPLWDRAGAQLSFNPGAKLPGEIQSFRVGGLTTLRYPDQAVGENRGLLYQFKVWIASAGLTTELPPAQSYARTPQAYDNTRYFGRERLSYMSGVSMPQNALTVDGSYVYHAFSGRADGSANLGFGLRKYNADQYLEWTKFFNHRLNRSYQVSGVTRDDSGNFYLFGSQYPVAEVITGPEDYIPGKDAWLAKLDPNGDLLWSYAADISGLGLMDSFSDAVLEGGYLYAVGVASTSSTGLDAFMRKFDLSPANGPAVVWTSALLNGSASEDDYAYGVAVGTGAVYMAGTLKNSTKDMFIRALGKAGGAPVGELITNDSAYPDEGYDLAITTTTPPYLYLGGALGKLEIEGSAYEKSDAALLQFTLDGGLARTITYDGKDVMDHDAVYAVKADASGVIVAGYEANTLEGRNTIVAKYDHDPAGSVPVWSRSLNLVDDGDPYTANYGDDEAYGLAQGPDGRIYMPVSLWVNHPGFYYFPEPNFNLAAYSGHVPGSVRLEWMNREYLPTGSFFRVQYSTFSDAAWSPDSAQLTLPVDYDIYEGMSVDRPVFGLDTGRDQYGNSIGPVYYFKVWAVPGEGGQLIAASPRPRAGAPGVPVLVSAVPASARAGEGWVFENVAMYPNDARLFSMGAPVYSYGDYEKEFPGVARDSSGNLYTLANMNWNGSDGFAVKKFNSAMQPLWTRFYAPGEWHQAKANRMAADSEGNLYITGYERAMASETGRDIFVLKLGASGAAWKTLLDFEGSDDTGYGVALDASGNVFVAGTVYTSAQYKNAYVAKLGPAGVLLTTAAYNGSAGGDDEAYGVAVRDGEVFLAGSSNETGQGFQFLMARFAAGDLAARGAAAIGDDPSVAYEEAAFDVAVGSAGVVYFAGQIYEEGSYSLDAAVVKSSADLTALDWAEPMRFNSQANGADSARAIALDAGGAVYAAGYTERYDINQDRNLWLRKYAPDGAELWTQEFHANAVQGGDPYAMGPSSDEGFSLAVGTMGFVSVGGKYGGYYGMYRYRQTNLLAVNPTLTVNVASGTASVPFADVRVALIPFSATGGIDVSGSTIAVTGASGAVSFQVPAGKQYFIALDRQGFSPAMRDQLMDPYGSYFVQLNADMTKSYILSPRAAADAYYPLTVRISSAAARDFVMAEVFFTATGEKAAYGIAQVPAGVTATTITVTNLPPVSAAGAYTLGVTIPGRSLARSIVMNALFPQTSSYLVSMSTMAGAVATTGGFEVGASTTPPVVEGVVRNFRTWAPIEQVRVRLYNRTEPCSSGNCEHNNYETLTDVNGKFSFYNVVSTAGAYNIMGQKAGYKRGGAPQFSVIAGNQNTSYREFQLEEATYTLRGYLRYRDVPVPNADVMVYGDYNPYGGGSDSYRGGRGMDTDARTKTGADGSFVFSTATANGLPDGQLRMQAAFFGNWMDLNEGNTQNFSSVDADDVRIVISSQGATGVANSNCTKGRVWKLRADNGACQSLATGDVNFNIMPPSQNDYATLSGSITFVTSYTVTAANPLVISTALPITVMAMEECTDCKTRSMGFAVISGTYTVNRATYSITLSTGLAYYTRVTSNEWGEVSSFDDRADFRSTMTTSVRMNFTVTRAGKLTGVVKMPDGSNYKPTFNVSSDDPGYHRIDINVAGQNVSVNEGWNVDEYGAFEFPNLAPGLYSINIRPEGLGFRWAAPALTDVSVVAGKTTQVTLKLEDGLYVQPQIIGLPEISTPTWAYMMVPVPSGTEMNQKKITEMFFGKDVFSFEYSTGTQVWQKRVMQVGQYDFYLVLGSRYNPGGGSEDIESYDHFGNFIGKVKGFNVQRNDATPNLGTESQPIPVNVLGSLGQETFEGVIDGDRLYTDSDLRRIFSNIEELFESIPAVMVYDAAGDLRGYTAGMPRQADFPLFWSNIGAQDLPGTRAYLGSHDNRFMVAGLPPGRYTVVFNNPNYPPVAKEVDVPLASSYNGSYAFDFDEQRVRVGTIYGTVRSTATGDALGSATVYLKHKTVEKFAETAADGSFTFDNMPAGIYRLEVAREGFVKAGEKTSLAGNDSVRLDLYLTPSHTNMTGKVFMSKFPSPVTRSGVKIVAYDETFNVEHPTEYLPKIEATTNDAGEYELAGVVPGHNYKVTAFHGGKQTYTLDVGSETVTEGVTYLPDIVMRDVPPQIVVKVRRSADTLNKADVTIKSPKALVTTPVCKVNPGDVYVATSAVSLALVPGTNNTYAGQFTISQHQPLYNVYVAAGDGSSRMEKSVTFSPNNSAKTEQYIQDEAIQGGEIQMDKESEEYSGIELDTGGLSYDQSGGASASSFRPSADGGSLVGGFFSSLPSVRTVKTAKGNLSLTQAITDLMASEIYNMSLDNASANKPFTLTLKYDKDKAADGANLRIYQYNETTGVWEEVPGNYTTDPMLGVLSVGVASLSDASAGASAAATPYGRKRLGMSAVVNGRYVPSAAGSSQSGRFAVFTARPSPSVAYAGADYEVANLPNPFSLKDKTVTNLEGTAAFGGATTYVTRGTLLKYHLPPGKSGSVKFVVYNLAGEKVRTVSDGVRAGGGMYYSEWDGKNDNNQDVASGVYFLLTYVDGEKLGAKAHKLAVIK